MRSLTAKLILAFLVASVAGVVLAAIFIRQFVAQQFNDYVLGQHRAAFIAKAGSYYAERGTWAGVGPWLHDHPPEDSPAPRVPGDPPAPQNHASGFVLLDLGGRVQIPFDRYRPDTIVSSAERAAGTPVVVNGQTVGTVLTVELTVHDPAVAQYLVQTDGALAAAGLVVIGIALVLGGLLARRITRPLRELTVAAQGIAAGDLGRRVPVRSHDELGTLATQFNRMSADLERATQLRRQMTADIAHDLRTPLTVLAGYLEALHDEVLKPTPERFATLYDETQLLLRLVEDLHTLALADAGELRLSRQPLAPRQLVERIAATHQHAAAQQGIALAVEAEEPLPEVSVDPEWMIRVLTNLVGNALRHTPAGGQVTLTVRSAPDQVQLIVTDTGSGIAPEHLSSIFERFYRADPARHATTGGSGLGLAIVKSLVEAHGGQVAVASALGQGTAFTITLPGG
jgi:signal transduction histidine kinase